MPEPISNAEMIAAQRSAIKTLRNIGYYPDNLDRLCAVLAHLERAQLTDTQADLTERARAIRRKIRQSFESEDPTWRSAVSRYSLTEKKADEFLAAALQSEREAAAAEARRAAAQVIHDWIADRRKRGADASHHYGFSHFEALAHVIASPSAPQEETR